MFSAKKFLCVVVIVLSVGMSLIYPALPVSAAPLSTSETPPAASEPPPATEISPEPLDAPVEPGQLADANLLPSATQPDLIPYTPSGWSYPVVPSNISGTTTVGSLNVEGTYLDWAIANYGTTTTTSFYTCIYLDGSAIVCWQRSTGLIENYYAYIVDYLYLGNVTTGNHRLKIVVDVNNNVVEANESNNTWEGTFYWSGFNCPSSSYDEMPAESSGTIMPDTFALPEEIQRQIASQRAKEATSDSNAPSLGWYDTSSFLTDTVAIGIVMPESAGGMENWSNARMNCVVSKIQTGMDWWKNRGGTQANLSFVYDVRKAVPTQYEPIDMSNSDVGLWIGETMTNLGFGGSSYWDQVYNYTNYLRNRYNTKWAVVYFVADSANDYDGRFKNSQYFGWTYIGGPYVVMTYDNSGWGIDDMNWVATHELGHDFGAGDQYYQAGYGGCTSLTQRYGYLGVANSNCGYNNPNNVPSIMRGSENALEYTAAGQLGWKDSNNNGIYDVVDTKPVFSLSGHWPKPTTETAWNYTGYVYDQPWAHAQCGTSDRCNDHDITVNTIQGVYFRINGGAWKTASAVDGSFNNSSEQFTFNTPELSVGTHTIEVQAINSRGGSKSWSETVTVQYS
jgi:hypothetical protein